MYQIFLINSSVDVRLDRFHILVMVNNAAVNTSMHVSFQIMFFSGYMPRSGISGSYSSYIFSFLRKLHTAVNSGCTNLHFHQQCRRVLFSPHPLQHYCLQTLRMDILIAVSCYLIVWTVLMCISLRISSVEHLFVGFLAICMSSLEKCIFGLLPIFCWVICILDWVTWTVCKFWKLIACLLHRLWIFSSILWVVFSFDLWFLLLCKSFWV